MKKVLALVLALVLVLSLAACGGSEERKQEAKVDSSKLTSAEEGFAGTKWISIYSGCTLDFVSDSELVYDVINATWNKNKNQINISYTENGKAIENTFDISEENGVTVLKLNKHGTIDGKTVSFPEDTFYPENQYEAVKTSLTNNLGDKVSTDIVEFTLDKAQFSYFASAILTNFAEPVENYDGGIFHAAKGRVYVCMTFTIKNTDRNTLDVGGTFADWGLYFNMLYNDQEYLLKGFDLNEKDGTYSLNFNSSAISYDGGKTFDRNYTDNILINAGQTVTLRTLGIAKVDPDSLTDPFELIINIPNSDDDEEEFIYVVK